MEITIKGTKFNQFISDNRDRTLIFLKSKYTDLSEDDIKDVYQESSLALFKNIQTGKLSNLTSSLYTYFLGICINQSLKALRKHDCHITIGINDTDVKQKNMVSLAKIDSIMKMCSEEETTDVTERKEKLVHSILDVMSPQCKKLLWSFYADDLNWATIADMNGLSNANSAKSTANRCRNTFKEKYNELKTKIYGN